jgi:putative DNA primase/helicase
MTGETIRRQTTARNPQSAPQPPAREQVELPVQLRLAQQENILAALAHHEEIGRLAFHMFAGPHIFEGDYQKIGERLWDYWHKKQRPPKAFTADLFADILEDPENLRAPTFRRMIMNMQEWSYDVETMALHPDDVIDDLVSFGEAYANRVAILQSAGVLTWNNGYNMLSIAEKNQEVQQIWETRRGTDMGRIYKIDPVDSVMLLGEQYSPRDYLLKPWLKSGSLTFIHAFRGDGKTLISMSIAWHVGEGRSFLGWQATRPARVLYVDGELAGEQLQERVRQLGPPSPNVFWLPFEKFMQQNLHMPDLATAEGQQYIEYLLHKHAAEVLILDNISVLIRVMKSGQSSNDEEYWRPIEPWLIRLRALGKTVIFLGHDGKSGKQRGTSKKEDTLDTVIGLKLDRKELATTINLEWEKHRDFHGAEAQPLVLTAQNNAHGMVQWSSTSAAGEHAAQIRELLDAGMTASQIIKGHGFGRTHVYEVMRKWDEERTAAASKAANAEHMKRGGFFDIPKPTSGVTRLVPKKQ